MKASVVVLNRNGETFLQRCLSSVEEATSRRSDIEVILADNGSTDDSVPLTRKLFPAVKVLDFGRNYGFAEANNKAAAVAKGEYLAFLNNDTTVDRAWLCELIRAADSDPSIAICGSRIMFMHSRDKVNHAGGKITVIGSGYDQDFGLTVQSISDICHTGYACGASMFVRRSAFQKLGGFDPVYFAFCEDVDLAWRAWIAGYKVVHVPTSIVYHKFSGTWHLEGDKLYYWHRNCKINILKNFQTPRAIRGIILNSLFDIVRMLEGLRNRSVGTTMSIVSGYYWILRNIRRILKSRASVSRQRSRGDAALQRIGIFASVPESYKEYKRARTDQEG